MPFDQSEGSSEPAAHNLEHLDLAEASPKLQDQPVQPPSFSTTLEWDYGRCTEDTIVEEATNRPSSEEPGSSGLKDAYPATSTMSLPGDVASMEYNHHRSRSADQSPTSTSHRGAAPAPWTMPRNKDGQPVSVTAEQMRRHKTAQQEAAVDPTPAAKPQPDQGHENADCFDSPWAPPMMLLLFMLLLLLLPGALFRVYSPDTRLGDVSIAGWAAIIAILIAIRPLVNIIYRVTGFLVVLVARVRKRSPAKVLHTCTHV